MTNALVAFKKNLGAMIDAKELALPTNVTPDAFRNAAIVAAQDNPQILDCEQTSVMKSIRTLAAAGLVPDGREAALVPFNTKVNGQFVKKCQAMPMVFGLVKMARRSGDVTDIRAHLVYQSEIDQGRFDYVVGDEERLDHRPILFGEKGDVVAVYAIARLKDGSLVREFMDAEDVDRIRRTGASQRTKVNGRYKASDNPQGIWKDHYGEMAKKTVIRRLCKRLDLSAEDHRRIMVEQDQAPGIRDVTPHDEERPNLAQRLAKKDAKPEHEATPEEEPAPVEERTVEDAEILPPEGDQEFSGDHDPTSLEFSEGRTAAQNGKALNECPYEMGTEEWVNWAAGWNVQKGEEANG